MLILRVHCSHRGTDCVEQIWVYGNSYESTLVAVVVPDKKELTGWAKDNGVDGDFEALVNNPKARTLPFPPVPLINNGLMKPLQLFLWICS
jgi:long-subunit acyl-CoA synthetase (AMP-forming)